MRSAGVWRVRLRLSYAYDEQIAASWESATADGRMVTPGYFRDG